MGDVERRTGGSVIATIALGDRVNDVVTNPGNSIAYAALTDSVALINSHHEISCVIPVGGPPRTLAIGADASRLYATNYGDAVSVIDISDHRVGLLPGACCVQQIDTADGALIYAASNLARGGWISVMDEGGTAVGTIDGLDGSAVTDLAADSEHQRLYVGLCRRSDYHQYDAGSLAVIDTATNAAMHATNLVGPPDSLTIGPDGAVLYATHYDHSSVTAIDLATLRVTRITLGDNPIGVQVTPDGLQAYVANRRSLSVIDTVAGAAERISVGDLPRCVRISPDGKYAYASNFGDHSVSIIDTIAGCVAETIDVGGQPEALALSPDGDRLYVGDYWSGTVTVLSVGP
ncbi:hypothetical protein A5692_24480 [Mycobacterium sp. E342]|nr:hypothetical protein A5692_24480 [Mycobacterium sp. E342]